MHSLWERGHVVDNIQKDLDAGFDFVVSLLEDPISADRIREKLSSESGELPPKLRIGELRDYEGLLEPLLYSLPPPLRPPKQKEERKVRRRRRAATPGPQPNYLAEPGMLPTPVAAEYLSLSPATLETLRVRGGGPTFVWLGARVVYEREDLDRWRAERKRKSTSDPGKGS